MYLFRLLLLAACLTSALCQFSLLSVPKPKRNSTKERKINTPNTVIHIRVGPKSTFSNESISSLSSQTTAKPISNTSSLSSLTKRSTEPAGELNETNGNPNELADKLDESSGKLSNSDGNLGELPTASNPNVPLKREEDESIATGNADVTPSSSGQTNSNANVSSRRPKFGLGSFSSFGDKPSIPSFENKAKPGFPSFGDQIKSAGKLANETANKFKNIPIVSEFLNIPKYFKVNNVKGAIDYMIKYGHLEALVSCTLVVSD